MGSFNSIDVRLTLVYLSKVKGSEDKNRKRNIESAINKKLQETQEIEKEELIILGDMNAHTVLFDEQRQ